MRAIEWLNQKEGKFWMPLTIIIIIPLGLIDYLTGPDYSLSLLYLIPVLLAAWFIGKWAGVTISVLSAIAWLIAELMGKRRFEDTAAIYWNDLMELGFFLVSAYLVSALKSALEMEKASSRTDHLTGIPNRRHFYELANHEISREGRYGHAFTIVYLDLDNFKTVNDTQGHSAGDRLLRLVSITLKDNIRSSDTVARLGGDEFALLLPETGADSARAMIGKLREVLFHKVQSQWPITFSIGMVTYRIPPSSVDEMVKKADVLMYEVKTSGKDRVKHEVIEGGGI